MTEENIEETQFEETTSQETVELDHYEEQDAGDNSEPDAEALRAENEKLKEQNAKLYARVKKPTAQKPVKDNSSLSREEAILFAKGYTEEEVNLANKLAKVEGISTLVAAEDPYVKGKIEERLKKEKSEKASLGASSGSSKFIPKDIGKMSAEDHAKLYHETMRQVQ